MNAFMLVLRMVLSRRAAAVAVVVGAVMVARVGLAATGTWTNTLDGTVASWTAAGNWNAATYPGQDGANQNASLTNIVGTRVYKAVIDASLPNSLGILEIKNTNGTGEAWVIVTNATMSSTSLIVRTRGRLEIDNLGIVTNVPLFTMDGNSGKILMGSGGRMFVSGSLYVGGGISANSNTLSISDNGVVVASNGFSVGYNGCHWNQLLVFGSNATIRSITPAAGPCIGYSGANFNSALFTGEGTVWDWGGSAISGYIGRSGYSNSMTISQGSLTLTNHSTLTVGYYGPTANASYNSLIVSNGGRFITQGKTLEIGDTTSSNNLARVTGSNSSWDARGGTASLGVSGAFRNQMIVDQGGTVTNASANVGASGATYGNSLLITNGSRWYVGSGGASAVGSAGTNNTAVVTGSGSLWNLGTKALTVGASSASTGNTLTISSGGSVYAGNLSVGLAGSQSNTAWIAAGCLLEANALTNGSPAAGNVITNDGGVFQFTKAVPAIVPNGAGGIALNTGAIAFRAITNADVKGNWTNTLANVTFSGSATFRLNNATNVVAGQDYTFATGLGATNYARLELWSSSLYRGGDVTVGNGGSLATAGSASAITNMAVLAGGTLEATLGGTNATVPLTALGTVTLGGSLQLTLTAPPDRTYRYLLINKTSAGAITGQFGSSAPNASYQGTNYVFHVLYAGGDGNDLAVTLAGAPETCIFLR